MPSIFMVWVITNYRLRFLSRDTILPRKDVMRRRELGLTDKNYFKNLSTVLGVKMAIVYEKCKD
jgi:hypothetical protein